MNKPKALKPITVEERSPQKQKWLDKAAAEAEQNQQLWKEVIKGRKPKSALRYQDEGGEFIRQGWPNGVAKSVAAHEKLFGAKLHKAVLPQKQSAPVPQKQVKRGDTFDGKRIRNLKPSGRTGKSGKRWEALKEGALVSECLAAGAERCDIVYGLARGLLELV